MSEPTAQLAAALERLRLAALRAFARRLGTPLAPEAARALARRYGLAGASKSIRRLARVPRPFRALLLRW
ncbi:MAG: hypothetical protein RMK73_07880, partial [Geminicoccaceae bacterium]|nr:hypothetical protein [Geminicoccaceae bacterium]